MIAKKFKKLKSLREESEVFGSIKPTIISQPFREVYYSLVCIPGKSGKNGLVYLRKNESQLLYYSDIIWINKFAFMMFCTYEMWPIIINKNMNKYKLKYAIDFYWYINKLVCDDL